MSDKTIEEKGREWYKSNRDKPCPKDILKVGYTDAIKDVEGLIEQRLKEIALLPAKYPMIDTAVLENELTDLLTQINNLKK